MLVMGVDPGAQHAGWCVIDTATCITAGVATGTQAEMACSLKQWANQLDLLVVERMQVYPHSPTPAGDLLDVSFTGGYLAGFLAPKVLVTPRPREWKGTIPKHVHHHRIKKTLDEKTLSLLDKIPTSLRHNAIDAIALAQWGAVRG